MLQAEEYKTALLISAHHAKQRWQKAPTTDTLCFLQLTLTN